jgi:hypothetical protein
MQTLYLIIFTVLGGLLTLFGAAGWESYQHKKLPATPMLFRWFVTGTLGFGLLSYALIYGAGADPSALFDKMSEALEVKEVMETLQSAVGGAAAEASKGVSELTVGMPTF